jgi:formate-dependent nitrite reductase membrane component NrfD
LVADAKNAFDASGDSKMNAWAEFLTWIEGSALGNAVRDAGVWAYGIINLFHILGIATLFGSILVLDLRLIGWRKSASLDEIASIATPLAAIGFLVAACSGLCLLATNGTEYIGNPFLPIKLFAIAFGLVNAWILSRAPDWRRSSNPPAKHGSKVLAICGALSLVCWLAAIAAGRMIGYW